MRKLLSIVVVAGVCAVAASFAQGAPAAAISCGKVNAGGKTWGVVVAAIKCSTGLSVVRKLAPKPISGRLYHYPGKYSGMSCIRSHAKGRSLIECLGKSGQLLTATTK
jgi:hypothetical protein